MIVSTIQQTLIDKHILCFGVKPSHLIQTPASIEWFGQYTAVHGGHAMTSTINRYLYASMSTNSKPYIRIFSTMMPVMTVDLNQLTLESQERYTYLGIVKSLLSLALKAGWRLSRGFDLFMQSDFFQIPQLGATSAFALTLIEAIALCQPKPLTLQEEMLTTWIQTLQTLATDHPATLADVLTMREGGTLLVDHHHPEGVTWQRTKGSLNNYRLLLLQVKTNVIQPRMLAKQILEQMNIIAQHYQRSRLIDIDALDFQHDLHDLMRMYGSKPMSKAQYFFQDQARAKLAYLGLEKGQDVALYKQLLASESQASEALDYLKIPGVTEQKLFATFQWLRTHLPDVHLRIQGSGFQGPILCMIPSDTYATSYRLLKRQFYETNLMPITLIKQGLLSKSL